MTKTRTLNAIDITTRRPSDLDLRSLPENSLFLVGILGELCHCMTWLTCRDLRQGF